MKEFGIPWNKAVAVKGSVLNFMYCKLYYEKYVRKNNERRTDYGRILNPSAVNIQESLQSVYGALVCCGARKMLIGDSIVGSGMTNACSPPADLRNKYLEHLRHSIY